MPSLREFREDNRAQSLGISNFILSLVAGAIVFYFTVVKIGGGFKAEIAGDGGQIGTQSTHWLNVSGDALIIVFGVVATFGLLLRAVRQRGRA